MSEIISNEILKEVEKMKIGLTYVKGALPGYENFGHLPTDIVKTNGLVNGNKASEELDALIIPGGSIVESEGIPYDCELSKEIIKMSKEGKAIIGICSGFQLLANQTDVGRKSEIPIIKTFFLFLKNFPLAALAVSYLSEPVKKSL